MPNLCPYVFLLLFCSEPFARFSVVYGQGDKPEKSTVLGAGAPESQPALAPVLGDEGRLGGAVGWLNFPPLSRPPAEA